MRTTYTMTPRMLVAALIQYNSSANQLGSNIRFRYEYQPGSDFFVVYSDGRDTLAHGSLGLLNGSFSIKFTRLLRSQYRVSEAFVARVKLQAVS